MTLHDKAQLITTVFMDIDGTMTDGTLLYGIGDEPLKLFSVRDGTAVTVGRRNGLRFGILSGLSSQANRARCNALHIEIVREGVHRKGEAMLEIFKEYNLKPEECMFIGDDLIDIPAMRECGISIAVGDAVPELDRVADIRTRAFGGHGAIRESVEWLLKEQGKWDNVIKFYFS